MKDWHAILGVEKTCTPDEIKSAYRKKAMEFHPDRNPSPEAKNQFIEIDTAYRVLSDPTFKVNTVPPPPKPKPAAPNRRKPSEPPRFKDSMSGRYFGQGREPPSTFKDSMEGHYSHQEVTPPPRRRPAPKPPEPEPKLWWGNRSEVDGYWKEYNRLKNSTAYEDPEVFWAKLDEWVKAKHKK